MTGCLGGPLGSFNPRPCVEGTEGGLANMKRLSEAVDGAIAVEVEADTAKFRYL